MSSRRVPLAIVASLAAATTAVAGSTAAASTAAAATRHYGHTPRILNDCQRSRVEPSRIVLFCGDGNQWLVHLHWSKWRSNAAEGSGTFVYNDCTPNCVKGHVHREPATVYTYRVRRHSLGRLFTRLRTTTSHGKQVYDLPTRPV